LTCQKVHGGTTSPRTQTVTRWGRVARSPLSQTPRLHREDCLQSCDTNQPLSKWSSRCRTPSSRWQYLLPPISEKSCPWQQTALWDESGHQTGKQVYPPRVSQHPQKHLHLKAPPSLSSFPQVAPRIEARHEPCT